MTLLAELLDKLLVLLGLRAPAQPIPVPVERAPRRGGSSR